jgi:hypothetical protein
MNEKEKYLQAMRMNRGRLDDISLGETLGLDEDTTRRIISNLLGEFRISYESFGACEYKINN